MTDYIACGLSYKTAPLTIREQIAPTEHEQRLLLQDLVSETLVSEAIILSTCNRTELYCNTTEPSSVIPWLAQRYRLTENLLETYSYTHFNQAAMHHTIQVACGIDSMMLGEPQILGQLKQAYQQADALGTIGKGLQHRFRQVFSTSKRIRTQTRLGNNPMSIASAAADLVRQNIADLSCANVLLIGSGDTTTLVGKYLRQYGVVDFAVASRTQANGEKLANQLSAKIIDINEIHQQLMHANVIISATFCPIPFITKNMVEQAIVKRGKPMLCVDLAIPRDIDPAVAQIDNVTLHNIDDLQGIVTEGMNDRLSATSDAESIIKQEIEQFQRQQQHLAQTNRIISDYRQLMQQQGQQEIDRALQSLAKGSSPQQAINELSRRLINKLIHIPTVKLRQALYEGHSGELLDLVKHLFKEDPS